jgi:predicted nucleic acid-binding protein
VRKTFIDTNVIVYANDRRDRTKQRIALTVIKDLMDSGHGVVSTQVLQEYAVTALAKLHQRSDVVLRTLVLLEALEVVQQTPQMIRQAVEISELYGLGFWDACIISNAEAAGCDLILSEDLNPGQFYSGIQLINPFAPA